ncbi:hypothetical protein [Ralstonia phage RPZH3]|nr:hypothetical protein [Ralstonia phage RPZH3]
MPSIGTAGSVPVRTSRALSGYLALIFPNSETWTKFGVPPRIDVPTRTPEPLANFISVVVLRVIGTICLMVSGRLSYASLILLSKISCAVGKSWAMMPTSDPGLNSAVSRPMS